jgi:hypothetical protein
VWWRQGATDRNANQPRCSLQTLKTAKGILKWMTVDSYNAKEAHYHQDSHAAQQTTESQVVVVVTGKPH